MGRAVIRECADRIEGKRVARALAQKRTRRSAIVPCYRMPDAVLIRPGYFRALLYTERGWRKSKVAD